jgi:ABC-type glutathione transport system ATPase component
VIGQRRDENAAMIGHGRRIARSKQERQQLRLVGDFGERDDADGNRAARSSAALSSCKHLAGSVAHRHGALDDQVICLLPAAQCRKSAMAQYVYSMIRVGKVVPPKREILKNISLSFFPGAKIGVLGLNGSGKSTLLRIMAGIDKEIEGEAVPMPGIKIGHLPQEPQLDPANTR